jgi:HAD superfamily hydrolase (TIGR01509 family)
MSRLNVVIPLAGAGSRFSKNLWHQGKPMIDVAGVPMLRRVIDNVNTDVFDVCFVFIARREYEKELEPLIRASGVSKFIIRYLDEVLQGAVMTLLSAAAEFGDETPVFVVNSDQILEFDKRAFYTLMKEDFSTRQSDGFVLTFVPEEKTTAWSYARLNAAGFIEDVKEKVVISDLATVGAYAWRTGADFVASARKMIAAGDTTNGEFYVAPVYNYSPGSRYKTFDVQKMFGTGVPRDLVLFCRDSIRSPPAAVSVRTSHPMRFIAHRGNTVGKQLDRENEPAYIFEALAQGYDVEVDAWCNDGMWRLGHDEPQYAVDYTFLLQKGLVVHAKNLGALSVLARDERVHCFSHDVDDVVLSSQRLLWTYPDKPLGENSVAVMFTGDVSSRLPLLDRPGVVGICADDVDPLRASLARPRHVINAVVFDLDGTLVETRDLHKEALNEALRCVAGAMFVISEEEHAAEYDGLSTAQKLKKLNTAKNLNPELNKAIWARKQELTNAMVSTTVKPDERIVRVISELKRLGYPVGVASNCIRSSVDLILKFLGIYHLVDLSVSNDDVEFAKPAPDIYLKAAACFGISPDEILVVEDAPFGWQSALLAGARLLRVKSSADVTLPRLLSAINDLNNATDPVVVIVPLAGPIPNVHTAGGARGLHPSLYDVRGRACIEHAISSIVSRRHPMEFVFVVLGDSIPDSLLLKAAQWLPTRIVRLQTPTRGALESVLAAEQFIRPCAPLLISDGSHVVEWRPGHDIDELLDVRGCAAAVSVTRSEDSRWSYANVDSDGYVSSVQEKTRISNTALTGLYMWRRGADFVRDAREAVRVGPRVRGLMYVAPVLNYAVSRHERVRAFAVEALHSLRTHAEAAAYAGRHYALARDAEFEEVHAVMRAKWSTRQALFTWNAAADGRTCMAAFAPATSANFRDDHNALLPIHVAFRDHLLYRVNANLHFTFLKLTGFSDEPPAPPNDVLFEALVYQSLKPFCVEFKEIIVTADSILMVGVPDIPLNDIRRTFLKHYEGALGQQDICHATLVRFTRPLTDAEHDSIKTLNRALAGVVMHVSELRLAACDYAMLTDKVELVYQL